MTEDLKVFLHISVRFAILINILRVISDQHIVFFISLCFDSCIHTKLTLFDNVALIFHLFIIYIFFHIFARDLSISLVFVFTTEWKSA
jgi:hypothetical protein